MEGLCLGPPALPAQAWKSPVARLEWGPPPPVGCWDRPLLGSGSSFLETETPRRPSAVPALGVHQGPAHWPLHGDPTVNKHRGPGETTQPDPAVPPAPSAGGAGSLVSGGDGHFPERQRGQEEVSPRPGQTKLPPWTQLIRASRLRRVPLLLPVLPDPEAPCRPRSPTTHLPRRLLWPRVGGARFLCGSGAVTGTGVRFRTVTPRPPPAQRLQAGGPTAPSEAFPSKPAGSRRRASGPSWAGTEERAQRGGKWRGP